MKKESYIKELTMLEELKKQVIRSLEKAPEGRIRAEMAKGKYPQYYYFSANEPDAKGRYLKKNEIELARACAQKEYDTNILNMIETRELELQRIIRIDETNKLKNVYDNLPEAKKRLISPYVLNDDDYISYWLNMSKVYENTIPMTNGYLTECGEMVRSKSEKMIADKLSLCHIPYKYENGLKLKNKNLVFPDFTLLKIKTREVFYLEHFGMMDNPEYCKKALEKIDMYEENGILLGEKLFATFESSLKPINMKSIEYLIRDFLL